MSNLIRAVIFDLDGVLVEAKDWHFDALNKALSIFGCDFSYEEHLTTYDGLPTKTKIKMLNKNNNFPLDMLKLKPEECVIVEDNQNGIMAAKASGAHCLEVKEVEDVNHVNVFNFISDIEAG